MSRIVAEVPAGGSLACCVCRRDKAAAEHFSIRSLDGQWGRPSYIAQCKSCTRVRASLAVWYTVEDGRKRRKYPTPDETRAALGIKASPATLTSHGHTRTKPKRKVERNQRELDALAALREEAAKRRTEENYIYLVGMEDDPAFVKIGEAFDPEDRYIGGQTWNPRTLVLLGYIDAHKAHAADVDLHREFARHQHKGEWFTPADEILSRFGVTRSEFLRRCGGTTLKEVKAA